MAAVALMLTGSGQVLAQHRRSPADPPNLSPGDRVRVWAFPGPRVTGTLVVYSPDLLAMDGTEREGLPLLSRPLFFPETRHYEFDWVKVRRIDVPNGRDVVRGIGGGVAGALFTGGMISGLCTIFGGRNNPECGVLKWSARAAPIMIPLGTVIGFFSTRWKRVY